MQSTKELTFTPKTLQRGCLFQGWDWVEQNHHWSFANTLRPAKLEFSTTVCDPCPTSWTPWSSNLFRALATPPVAILVLHKHCRKDGVDVWPVVMWCTKLSTMDCRKLMNVVNGNHIHSRNGDLWIDYLVWNILGSGLLHICNIVCWLIAVGVIFNINCETAASS